MYADVPIYVPYDLTRLELDASTMIRGAYMHVRHITEDMKRACLSRFAIPRHISSLADALETPRSFLQLCTLVVSAKWCTVARRLL